MILALKKDELLVNLQDVSVVVFYGRLVGRNSSHRFVLDVKALLYHLILHQVPVFFPLSHRRLKASAQVVSTPPDVVLRTSRSDRLLLLSKIWLQADH